MRRVLWIGFFSGLFCVSGAEAAPSKSGVQSGKVIAQKASGKAKNQKKPAKKPASKPRESRKPAKKPGQAPAKADASTRAAIAGKDPSEGPKVETAPELEGLREVDRTLFFDLMPPLESTTDEAVRVSTSGLPSSPLGAETRAEPAPRSTTTEPWMTALRTPDLPFRWDDPLVRYLRYFKESPQGRSFVSALLKRSGRYGEPLKAALKVHGLPEDLVYLALCESGMNPRILSHAGAAGLWQFMPKAGQAYGLRVDHRVDERLDPKRSTDAAIRFLDDLHERFGRWELAMAAYNMGQGGLLTSIRKYNTNDFWELSRLEAAIPYETALYVPKIVAVAFVARNREAFGLGDLILDEPEKFDVAKVGPSVPLDEVAKAAGVPPRDVAALNPALLGSMTPPSADPGARFEVKVPAGAKPVDLAGRSSVAEVGFTTHQVRWGESLEHIARRTGTTEAKLRAKNGLHMSPRPGTTITIPTSEASSPRDRPVFVVSPSIAVPPGKKRVFYEVVWGDTLPDIARALGVPQEELERTNRLESTAKLAAKMTIQAFVDPATDLSNVHVFRPEDGTILEVGSAPFFDHFEGKNGRQRQTIQVAPGDTFGSLAKKHGLSLGMMERINHRSRQGDLVVGESLVVYTTRKGPPPTRELEVDPDARTPVEARQPEAPPPVDEADPEETPSPGAD